MIQQFVKVWSDKMFLSVKGLTGASIRSILWKSTRTEPMASNINSFHPLSLIHLYDWRDIAALIGSRAIYGQNTSHVSDFDYIFPEGAKQEVIKTLNDNNVQFTTNNFGTIKIVVKVRDYAIPFSFNIIFLDECNFAAWSKATKLLKVILNNVNINKTDRLKMFNALVQEYGEAAITNTPSF